MIITDDKFWEKINKVSNDDILSMVMDFKNERINSSELMDRINARCMHTFAQLQCFYEKEIKKTEQRTGNLEDTLSLIKQHTKDDWAIKQINEVLE